LIRFSSQGPKKAPNQLNPISDYEYDPSNDEMNDKFNRMTMTNNRRSNNGQNNNNSNNKISIPIDANTLRDKNHINVDIYLRLDEYMPKGNVDYSNRSLEDFDPQNDPLAKHIRYYETNISRSLPGSSGSINKYKTLPPLSKQQQQQHAMGGSSMNVNRGGGYDTSVYNKDYDRTKPRSHQEHRSSRSFDFEAGGGGGGANGGGGGYLQAMERNKYKEPTIKPYTLKDYRRFKKDALIDTNTSTGKLGFDYDNENYKQKVNCSRF
jgi:hypothetical protein